MWNPLASHTVDIAHHLEQLAGSTAGTAVECPHSSPLSEQRSVCCHSIWPGWVVGWCHLPVVVYQCLLHPQEWSQQSLWLVSMAIFRPHCWQGGQERASALACFFLCRWRIVMSNSWSCSSHQAIWPSGFLKFFNQVRELWSVWRVNCPSVTTGMWHYARLGDRVAGLSQQNHEWNVCNNQQDQETAASSKLPLVASGRRWKAIWACEVNHTFNHISIC